MTGAVWLDLLGFVALLMAVAWHSRRRTASAQTFLVADRAVGLFPLVATLVMTEFNTSTLLAFSAVGYTAGPMALALPLVFLVGLGFYTASVARAWKRFDRLSVAELFATRYSPALGRFASLCLLAAMTGFSATYVKSIGLVFQPLQSSLPFWALTAGLSLLVLAVVLPGGLRSVVRSDVVSFIVTLGLLPALLAIGMSRANAAGGLEVAFAVDQLTIAPMAQWTHPALPFWFVTSLIVLTSFTYIAAPWYGQKIFAARDERTAFMAVAISAVLVFLLYGSLVLAAAYLRVVMPDLADPQLAVPMMMLTWLPPAVRGVGLAVLFAAALTTLGGVWTAMAAMVAADFGWHAATQVWIQRGLLIGFAVLSWLGAIFLMDDILNRLILANVPVAGLAFALLAGFHWPRATAAGAWASTVVGIAWGAGAFILVGETGGYTWPWAIYGLPLIFATGVIVSWLTSPAGPPSDPTG
ncbi:MAG: sodium:solute symporter family protein [Acidobacteriota bacterium]